MPNVKARLPLGCNAAKTVPARPTKMPDPRASYTLSEDALRPCSAAADKVIAAKEVLEVASPMPRPAKIQLSATKTYGSVGTKAISPKRVNPKANTQQPNVIRTTRRHRSHGLAIHP